MIEPLLLLVSLILLFVLLSRLARVETELNDLRGGLREVLFEVKGQRSTSPPAPVGAAASDTPTRAIDLDPVPAPPVAPGSGPDTPPKPIPDPSPATARRGAVPPPLPRPRPFPESRPAPEVRPTAAAASSPAPAAAAAAAAPSEPGKFESSVREILARIWNWIIVGEEHRREGVTMEFAVATTWMVRLGVLIFVIGIGFLLKYGIDNGRIGPQLRVLFSTLTGAALLGGGLRLFGGRYGMLGQGLVGAGIATLYFSFFTAHQPGYALLGPVAAFALMVLVTVVAGLVAVRRGSLLVAVLGLLGGYGTPLMIEVPAAGVPLLFSYLLLLGLGVFGVASRRNWRLLHYLAFAATFAHVARNVGAHFTPAVFWHFLPFVLGFFVLFSSTTFVHQILHRRPSTLLELLFLFLNAAAFTGFAAHLIEVTYAREAISLLTLGLAVFYILHVVVFLRRGLRDRGLLLSFLGLAAFHVAVTLPIVLSKGWITVSWSLQAFVMLWIASKMRSEFLRQLAYLLYLIVLARFAAFDLNGQFGNLDSLSAVEYGRQLVERLFVFGGPIASFVAAARLFRHEASPPSSWSVGEGNDIAPLPGQSGIGRICFWIVVGLTFLYLNLEVAHTVDRIFTPLVRPGLTLVWIGFAALLLREMVEKGSSLGRVLFWILCAALLWKVVFFDFLWWKPGFDLAFAPAGLVPGFLMRLLNYGATASFLVVVAHHLGGRPQQRDLAPVFGYAALAAVFLYSSLEIWTALTLFLPASRLAGISIFWSVFAVTLLLTGILRARAALRAIGLILLAITIFKVFVVDLAGLDPLYRIVAFIVLGVVILAGSFVYFKFSHRFTTSSPDEAAAAEPDRPAE